MGKGSKMVRPSFFLKWQYGQKVRKRLRREKNDQIKDLNKWICPFIFNLKSRIVNSFIISANA